MSTLPKKDIKEIQLMKNDCSTLLVWSMAIESALANHLDLSAVPLDAWVELSCFFLPGGMMLHSDTSSSCFHWRLFVCSYWYQWPRFEDIFILLLFMCPLFKNKHLFPRSKMFINYRIVFFLSLFLFRSKRRCPW